MDPKAAARQATEDGADGLVALSHRIHAHPEVSFEEVAASRWGAEAGLGRGGLVDASLRGGPRRLPPDGLLPLATVTPSGVDVLVVNASLRTAVHATIRFDGVAHGRHLVASVLNGPEATAYNTAYRPRLVRTRTSPATVATGAVA